MNIDMKTILFTDETHATLIGPDDGGKVELQMANNVTIVFVVSMVLQASLFGEEYLDVSFFVLLDCVFK